MITDLLIAGLLVASAPDLLPSDSLKSAPLEHRSDAARGVRTCPGEAQDRSRNALLEAHAAYAAMAPFSLARIAPGSAPVIQDPAREVVAADKGSSGCRS